MRLSRYTFFILITCVAFVGMFAAIKVQQNLEQGVVDTAMAAPAGSALAADADGAVDPSFFQDSSSTDSADPAASSSATDQSPVAPVVSAEQPVAPAVSAETPAPLPPVISAAIASITADVSTDAVPAESAAAPAPVAPTAPATPAAPVDPVSAEAYLVGDVMTGKIYLQKNSSTVLPAASMSKLLNAITATDMYAPTTTIAITAADTDVPPDGSNLQAGESFTEQEMLYPLLLDSSNVAAEALASARDRAAFLELMSSYAWEVGMSGAFFADPSGLSENDQGSAEGFFKLAQYLYTSRPDILAITRIPHISVGTTTDHGAHDFVSIHPFVDDPRFIGGKTGHTNAALDTMLTILNIDGHPIAIVVLRSLDRTKDTQLLIGEVEKAMSAGS